MRPEGPSPGQCFPGSVLPCGTRLPPLPAGPGRCVGGHGRCCWLSGARRRAPGISAAGCAVSGWWQAALSWTRGSEGLAARVRPPGGALTYCRKDRLPVRKKDSICSSERPLVSGTQQPVNTRFSKQMAAKKKKGTCRPKAFWGRRGAGHRAPRTLHPRVSFLPCSPSPPWGFHLLFAQRPGAPPCPQPEL